MNCEHLKNIGGDCGLCNHQNDCPEMCVLCGAQKGHDYYGDLCEGCGDLMETALQHSEDFECSFRESLEVFFADRAAAAANYMDE